MELTAVDGLTGSTATVTVTGNTGTATLYLSRFAGTNASRAFVASGSISGNGSIALTELESGPYVAVAVNAVPEFSPPIFFRVSDVTESLHYRCLAAVREYVMSLALPQVSANSDEHVICKLPYRPDLELDLESDTEMGVMYFPIPETYSGANNEEDQVVFGVQVLLIRKVGSRLFQGLATLLKDREILGRSLSICPLPDLDEIHTVNVQPGAVVLPEHWVNKYDASSVVFRCITEQESGIL